MKTILALVALMVAGTSGADELAPPLLKDGLWQHKGTQISGTTTRQTSSKACENHLSQQKSREMSESLRKRSQCTVKMSHPSSDVYVSEMQCAAGPNHGGLIKGTATYHGDSYKIEQHRIVGSQDTVVMVMEGKYLGACPADMKPGDTIMADGTKINMLEQ